MAHKDVNSKLSLNSFRKSSQPFGFLILTEAVTSATWSVMFFIRNSTGGTSFVFGKSLQWPNILCLSFPVSFGVILCLSWNNYNFFFMLLCQNQSFFQLSSVRCLFYCAENKKSLLFSLSPELGSHGPQPSGQ